MSRLVLKGTLAAALLASGAILPAIAAEVTPDRLLNAAQDGDNWLMINRTYDSHRFSPLTEINRENAKNLHVAFATAIGGLAGPGYSRGVAGHQSTPLVEDGMMYVVDGWGTVYKIDVKSGAYGRVEWVMDPGVDHQNIWIASNRGMAMIGNNVISVTGDGKVNWTNMDSGELVNSVQVDDPSNGYSLTTAPLAIGDKLIVGGSGGDRGARDHIDAISAADGKPIWRTYSIPAPGEPGSETWKDNNNAWEHGGGAFWMTGSYDPEQNVTIWGTGQPVPMFDPEYRPGDNLFTNSAVAYDVDSGAMKWYFQYTPGDFLDYDEIGVHQLIDAEINGETRKIVAHFGRNGFFYVLDRTNGQFINAAQYVKDLTWTAGIDPKTGKPVEYDPSKDLQTYAIGAPSREQQGQLTTCPNIQGGVNYFPTSYSESAKLAYGAGIEGCSNVTADRERAGGKVAWNGGLAANADRHVGSITSMNPASGERVAQHMFDYAAYGGVTSTAGGVVFTDTVDGTVFALDDKTLDVLWQFNAGSVIAAPPMTYAVGGKQYVAVLVGGGPLARGTMNKSPEMADIQDASMLFVFSL